MVNRYILYIIPYQAITGNNNKEPEEAGTCRIIPYQAITGNNNCGVAFAVVYPIIPYQAITGNNNKKQPW